MNYTKSFLKIANSFPSFEEAVRIVKNNSEGNVWLIGGFVYRSIIQDLYEIPTPEGIDFDFLVEKPKEIKLPSTWRIKENSYGNPKLINPYYEIDYIPLSNVHSIKRRNLEPTIENFLSGTPLNIQSIIFDVTKGEIIGDIGIQSIKEKVISINNLAQAKYRAEIEGINLRDLVSNTANQFGFKASLDDKL